MTGFAIDTRFLVENLISYEEDRIDRVSGSKGRYKVDRVCVHAIVVHDLTVLDEVGDEFDEVGDGFDGPYQAAFDWQADADDDLDELEVLHHLKQVALTSPSVRRIQSLRGRNNAAAATTLVANVQSQELSARMQDPPSSSFRRHSRRISSQGWFGRLDLFGPKPCWHSMPNTRDYAAIDAFLFPKFVGLSGKHTVIWHAQVDFVDLHTPRALPDRSAGKRRRSTINLFHQVPPTRYEQQPSRAHHSPEKKKFKGVRWRPDHNRWVAETKPRNSKKKVWLGEFPSQTKAARVVDVAFHHYGKPLNFPDTTEILSTQPKSEGLNADEKLNLVKEQANWVASIASTLPSSPASPFPRGTSGIIMSSAPRVEISESSRRRGIAEFRSLSDISSWSRCLGADEADDGVSQSPPWVPPTPLASIAATWAETTEPDLASIDHAGVVPDFGEPSGRSSVQSGVQDAIAAPCDIGDYARVFSTDLVNSPGSEHSSGVQIMCMDFLTMSPPAPLFQIPSPGDFQGEVADCLLEQQNFQGVDRLEHSQSGSI